MEELHKYQLDIRGSVAVLRQRLVGFVKQHEKMFVDRPADPSDYNEELDRTRDEEEEKKTVMATSPTVVASDVTPPSTSREPSQETLALSEDGTSDDRHQAASPPIQTGGDGTIPSEEPHAPEGHHTPPTRGGSGTTSTPARGSHRAPPFFPTSPHTLDEERKVEDQMRKWNCYFEGKDVYSFLERLGELRFAYGINERQLLQGPPELLRGDALHWYRTIGSQCTSWADFEDKLRGFYLPPLERRQLSRQIAERMQRPQETIRTYVTALQTLMRRRGGYSVDEQLDNLYFGMRPELKLHIRRTQVPDVMTLVQLVEEHETILLEMKKSIRITNTAVANAETPSATPTTRYNRREHCWRCKQRGHSCAECRNPRILFCSVCGKDGVYTKDYHELPAGNDRRVEIDAADSRPHSLPTPADMPSLP